MIRCSSGPNDESWDLPKFGGTLITACWAKKHPYYVLKK
jgi:hypothetical protein